MPRPALLNHRGIVRPFVAPHTGPNRLSEGASNFSYGTRARRLDFWTDRTAAHEFLKENIF
jgi:hypothetical protein